MEKRTKIIAIIVLVASISVSSIVIVFVVQDYLEQVELANKEVINAGESFEYNGVTIQWFLCEAIKLKFNSTVVYIDPNTIPDEYETADYIVITHSHGPHLIRSEISKISDDDTVLISQPSVAGRDFHVTAGDSLDFENVSFEFVYMYNVDKFRPNGLPYHVKGAGVGVIVDFDGVRVYHAGDTDVIPEMRDIRTDIALLPVSGQAWMTASEAAEAVEYLKVSSDLKYAIPFHYGYNGVSGTTGNISNANRFAELAICSVVILDAISIIDDS
jgi:L-ascorbate metabolism protein UlaG (beta-lactamase superfamily)